MVPSYAPLFFFPPPAPLISVAKVEFVACTEEWMPRLDCNGGQEAKVVGKRSRRRGIVLILYLAERRQM